MDAVTRGGHTTRITVYRELDSGRRVTTKRRIRTQREAGAGARCELVTVECGVARRERCLEHRLRQRCRRRCTVEASLLVARIRELHDDDELRRVARKQPHKIRIVLLRRVAPVDGTSRRSSLAGEAEAAEVRL